MSKISGVRECQVSLHILRERHPPSMNWHSSRAVRMNNIFGTSPIHSVGHFVYFLGHHSKALPSAVYCGANGVFPLSGLGQVAWQAKSFMRKEW